MDQLAECVGVSRRTLFNYAPSKLDAVIGIGMDQKSDLFAQEGKAVFVAGGPTGSLLKDTLRVMADTLSSQDATADELDQLRRLMAKEPRLLAAIQERNSTMMRQMADAIAKREGTGFDPRKTQVAISIAVALFDEALTNFITDRSASLADHFRRLVQVASDLANEAS
jgi:AcrR family transcriptional regulator